MRKSTDFQLNIKIYAKRILELIEDYFQNHFRTPPTIKPPPSSASMNFGLDQRIQQQQQSFSMVSSPFSQTTSSTVSMSQIQQPPRNPPNMFQPNFQLSHNVNAINSMNAMNTMNNVNVLMANPVHASTKTTDNKQVQLSAQEINDFLS